MQFLIKFQVFSSLKLLRHTTYTFPVFLYYLNESYSFFNRRPSFFRFWAEIKQTFSLFQFNQPKERVYGPIWLLNPPKNHADIVRTWTIKVWIKVTTFTICLVVKVKTHVNVKVRLQPQTAKDYVLLLGFTTDQETSGQDQ